jgi:hypothetical protein
VLTKSNGDPIFFVAEGPHSGPDMSMVEAVLASGQETTHTILTGSFGNITTR